jgi:flagellar motor protein MotB
MTAWRKGILLGVLAIPVFSVGCASDRERTLQLQNQQLNNHIDELRRRNADLEKENRALKDAGPIRDEIIKMLKEKNEALQRAFDELLAKGIPVTGNKITLYTDMLFRPGSDDISKEGAEKLREVANVVKKEGLYLRIEGHTDNDPIKRHINEYPTKMNLELGAARAIAVAEQLKKDGVNELHMHAVSMGESVPVADNSTKEGKRQNRRVEIYLLAGPPEGGRSSEKGLEPVEKHAPAPRPAPRPRSKEPPTK